MSIIEQIGLRQVNYYGKNDLSTNWLMNDFQKHQNLILQSLNKYDDYGHLLTDDFILGFYILNLFFLNKDIMDNVFTDGNLQLQSSYNNEILKIMSILKLQNLKDAIIVFKNWFKGACRRCR